jgi:excisionase family DNA binding protein
MEDIKVYTPEEVAEILSVTEITVLKWLRAGTIKGFKAGSLWRISEQQLRDFINGGSAAD